MSLTVMPVVPLPAKTPNSVFSNVTNVPPTPQDLPSDDDAVQAHQYTENAIIAKRQDLIDDPSFVEALRYQNDLLLAKSAHPIPPWFTQAMKAFLDDIKQHIKVTIQDAIDELKETVKDELSPGRKGE
ncbi:hypothetical protein DFH08DRAFT_1087171 [Mycena albidolilacea]|uniref:Uncharacterized protein n=1 Tax=Mycena albidolilacea TaxID=1033008 RepID=A0AAD7EDD3_9AGAR|nr:hypothetical protein DFH08DRAFT_1087171 [Mycena albidolilacea]